MPRGEKKLWGGEFWTRGYYIGTVGEYGSEDVIREYVRKQGRNLENYQKLHEVKQLELFYNKESPPQSAKLDPQNHASHSL